MRIELNHISKHYGTVRANDDIQACFDTGTIHGILGENGAGKSTLMKILTGAARPTNGTIGVDGQPVRIDSPADATRLGIGMLFQEPLDFPALNVWENFMAARSANRTAGRSGFASRCRQLGFELNPSTPVRHLTIGQRQQLEIVRLLSLGVRVLILDEPTTGISSGQKAILFEALKTLCAEGASVILVSHKLADVVAVCQQVTVLRHGRVSGEMVAPFDSNALLTMMFGTRPQPPPRSERCGKRTVLSLQGVTATGGRTGLHDCSTKIRAGEIVALAGLEGSGQGVFLRVAAGIERALAGKIAVNGKPLPSEGYHLLRQSGVAFLPADRMSEGLVSGLSIREHFALLRSAKGVLAPWQAADREAERRIEQFRIKGKPSTPIDDLSGGNQQRLLLSFLPSAPTLLLLENPTRGLDLDSAHWLWGYLQQFSAADCAIVFASDDLDEILMVAQRVLVFFDGRLVADLSAGDTDPGRLGQAIAGKA